MQKNTLGYFEGGFVSFSFVFCAHIVPPPFQEEQEDKGEQERT